MKVRLAAVAIVFASAPLAAHADVFAFNFTPLPSFSEPLDPLSFTLDTSQPPTSSGPAFDGSALYYSNVSVQSNGLTYTREVGFGTFYTFYTEYEFGVGQSVILNVGDINLGTSSPRAGFFSDVPIFSGSVGTPVFLPGVYTVPLAGILTITDQTTSVTPEPSTFALLGTGILGIAGMLRQRVAKS